MVITLLGRFTPDWRWKLLLNQGICPLSKLVAWRRYLASWQSLPRPTTRLTDQSTPWILRYLTLRNLIQSSDKALATRTIRWNRSTIDQLLNTPMPQDLPETFAEEWWQLLGQTFMEKGFYESAAVAYGKAAALPGNFQSKPFIKSISAERDSTYQRNQNKDSDAVTPIAFEISGQATGRKAARKVTRQYFPVRRGAFQPRTPTRKLKHDRYSTKLSLLIFLFPNNTHALCPSLPPLAS